MHHLYKFMKTSAQSTVARHISFRVYEFCSDISTCVFNNNITKLSNFNWCMCVYFLFVCPIVNNIR